MSVLNREFLEEELIDFYSNNLDLGCKVNDYVAPYDADGKSMGLYKWNGTNYEQVLYKSFKSTQFGEIKPKDIFQQAYFDSIAVNQLTITTGPAGTGKSLGALAYAFQELEKGKISKIIVFNNTPKAAGSAALGYLPGSKNEKLLDSVIGNILISKLGGRQIVDYLISREQLILLPMSDARGYETPSDSLCYFTETQNLDIYLMKLLLQRLGENTKAILEGDIKQTDKEDLFGGNKNGIKRAIEVFSGEDYFGHVELKNVYRSRIAKKAEEM